MVAFTDVRTFLKRSSEDPAIKARIRRFFRKLQRGDIAIHGVALDDIQQLFAMRECGVNLMFLVLIDLVEGCVRDTLPCLSSFEPEDMILEDILELIDQFLDYQFDHGLVPTDEQSEPLLTFTGRLRVAFLLGQDHEGIMPMLAYSRQLHPAVAARMIRDTMLTFLANGPTHYQPVD